VPLPDRPFVAVGGFREDALRCIREAAAGLGVPLDVAPRAEDVAAAPASPPPLAVVLAMDGAGAAQACATLRSQARLAQVPIFGVAPELNDLAYGELFAWGGDDLVATASSQPMTRRLRALRAQASAAPAEPVVAKDQAIVAGAQATWRTVMGRALYNGGFAVRFAANAEGLAQECLADGVRVVVVAEDLAPEGGVAALATARARGSKAAWILVTAPKRMAAAHAAAAPLGPVSVVDGFAPPENVLFLTNELLAPRGVDKRASPRLLYGTTVAFRPAGREEDELGFSYNVSAGGVFVRTLAAPDPKQEVWLELWPPRSERRVRLAGMVAWRRAYGRVGATVPAGFGVQLTDGLAGDLDRWRAGYDAFAQSLLGATAS